MDFNSFIESKFKSLDFGQSFFENKNEIDQLIEYGYIPLSIEYCLKYDMIDDFTSVNDLNQDAEWSPFEWSNIPKYLDLLSFAVFFGSIKCFKYLLMNEFEINEEVISMVACSGCFDLFHLCQGQKFAINESFVKASIFFHLPLLVFLLENGADINAKNEKFESE